MVSVEFFSKTLKELYANYNTHKTAAEIENATSHWFAILKDSNVQEIQGAIYHWSQKEKKLPRAENIKDLLKPTGEGRGLAEYSKSFYFQDYSLAYIYMKLPMTEDPHDTYEWIKTCRHLFANMPVEEIRYINEKRTNLGLRLYENFTEQEQSMVYETIYGKETADWVNSVVESMKGNNFQEAVKKMDRVISNGIEVVKGKYDKFISKKEGSLHPEDYNSNLPDGINPELGF